MRASRIALIILCLCFWSAKAGALTLDRICLVPLVKASDYVVHGTVEDVRALDDSEQNTILASLTVTRVLKGENVPRELKVGFTGIVTEKGHVAAPPHEATLAPAEEVVLFLTRLDEDRIRISSGVQGKFIVSETEGGQKTVRSAIEAIPLCSQDPEDRPSEMSLTGFLELLRKIATYPQ
jgi:hypothetical protein